MDYILKKEVFYVNSNNRLSGSHSNFKFKIDLDVNAEYDSVAVLSASVPKSYYLVSSNNNSFVLKEGNDTVTIILPSGNYTRSSICSTVQNLLNNNSPNGYNYSVSFQNINTGYDDGKLTFDVTGNGSTQPQFIFTTQLHEQLGFEPNSTNTFINNSLKSVDVINLTKETTLFIRSDIAHNSEQMGHNILQEIFTTGDASFSHATFINYNPRENSKPIANNQSNIYEFILTDENGREIDTNGININFTILVYKKNDLYSLIKSAIKYFTIKG